VYLAGPGKRFAPIDARRHDHVQYEQVNDLGFQIHLRLFAAGNRNDRDGIPNEGVVAAHMHPKAAQPIEAALPRRNSALCYPKPPAGNELQHTIEEHMKSTVLKSICLLGAFMAAAAVCFATGSSLPDRTVSGKIINGIRILPVPNTDDPVILVVYRGDYVKFDVDPSLGGRSLAIPGLAIKTELSRDITAAPYFKMKQTGSFAFTLGKVGGQIWVIDYVQEKYAEVTSAEARQIIDTRNLLVLDVRTPAEYKRGHLENAVLIPVQILQQNLGRLAAYKDQDILVYCATGNRSTVAAKILIDDGFNRVINLRHGIVDWHRHKHPIVR